MLLSPVHDHPSWRASPDTCRRNPVYRFPTDRAYLQGARGPPSAMPRSPQLAGPAPSPCRTRHPVSSARGTVVAAGPGRGHLLLLYSAGGPSSRHLPCPLAPASSSFGDPWSPLAPSAESPRLAGPAGTLPLPVPVSTDVEHQRRRGPQPPVTPSWRAQLRHSCRSGTGLSSSLQEPWSPPGPPAAVYPSWRASSGTPCRQPAARCLQRSFASSSGTQRSPLAPSHCDHSRLAGPAVHSCCTGGSGSPPDRGNPGRRGLHSAMITPAGRPSSGTACHRHRSPNAAREPCGRRCAPASQSLPAGAASSRHLKPHRCSVPPASRDTRGAAGPTLGHDPLAVVGPAPALPHRYRSPTDRALGRRGPPAMITPAGGPAPARPAAPVPVSTDRTPGRRGPGQP